MRTIFRGAFLWLGRLFFGLPRQQQETWQGATEGWSPKAAVKAVEGPTGWDVEGWRRAADKELHRALNDVEHTLWSALDELLTRTYEWRDREATYVPVRSQARRRQGRNVRSLAGSAQLA
jgi:hypothetical protein